VCGRVTTLPLSEKLSNRHTEAKGNTMQVVRRYRVKVYSMGQDNGTPYGDTYVRESVNADRISEMVAECIASVVSAGEMVHSVHVEPYAEFIP
jgi:hypothetical protein